MATDPDHSVSLQPPDPTDDPFEGSHETSLTFEGRDGLLYANGHEFSFKGVNWWEIVHHTARCPATYHAALLRRRFGSEAFNGPPGGLHAHTVGWCDVVGS